MIEHIRSLIIETLRDGYNYNASEFIVKREYLPNLAEDILDMLEFQGMLPPPDGYDAVTSNIIYAYYDERVEEDRSEQNSQYTPAIISKLWESENKLEPEDDE